LYVSIFGFSKEIPFSEAGEVPRDFEKKIRPLPGPTKNVKPCEVLLKNLVDSVAL
jgi:hypothetical protein